MRSIAHELGCSTGVLLHYFADKEDLLGYAMVLSFEKLRKRLEAAAADKEPLRALRLMALAALPMDEESRVQWHVWLVFLSRARANDEFGQQARQRADDVRRDVEGLLKMGKRDGAVRGSLDVAKTAQRLLAAIDGFALRMIFDPDRYSRKRVEALVDSMLDELAPGAI